MSEEHGKEYFGQGATGQDRGRQGTFTSVEEEVQGLQVAEGVVLRPVLGENILMSFVYMEPHSVAAEHSHAEEQMGTVIEGECEFEINGVKRILRRGECYFVPPNVPHAARTHEKGCVALDVFNPPRKALLEAMQKAEGTNGRGA